MGELDSRIGLSAQKLGMVFMMYILGVQVGSHSVVQLLAKVCKAINHFVSLSWAKTRLQTCL